MKTILSFVLFPLLLLVACNEPDKELIITPEIMAGTWEIIDGKCMMKMYLTFQGLVISDSTEQIEFKLIEEDKIKVEKRIPILVWGIYQKRP